MAASTDRAADDSLYPIAVLIDELKNEDIQVRQLFFRCNKNQSGNLRIQLLLLVIVFGDIFYIRVPVPYYTTTQFA